MATLSYGKHFAWCYSWCWWRLYDDQWLLDRDGPRADDESMDDRHWCGDGGWLDPFGPRESGTRIVGTECSDTVSLKNVWKGVVMVFVPSFVLGLIVGGFVFGG
jgi:hypothetical protein